MRKKVLLLGLTLATLALALWFALARRTDADAVALREPAPPAAAKSAAVVADAETVRESRAEATAPVARVSSLRVRSSAGIPLAFVEIEREGSWVRHELVDGALDALTEKLPTLLRAPGHVARPIEAAEGELVVEPDALLVIEGRSLRDCLASAVPAESWCRTPGEFREARGRAIADGWISPSEYGVAVAYDRLEPIPRDVDILLVRADRGRMKLELACHPGLRARWEMPCAGQAKGSPLEIEVQRPAGERGRIQLVLYARGAASLSIPPPEFSFGKASPFSADLYEELEIAPEEDRARFEFALIGRQHVLAAFDLSTRAYGRITFEHDGTPRVIPLREPLEISGRVLDKETHAPLRRVSMLLQDSGGTGWIIEAQDLGLDPRGAFSFRGPSRVLANERTPLDPPRTYALIVQAPGYDDGRFLVERSAARALDVGEIVLVRHENPLVLAAGHGLDPKVLDGQYVVFADKPEELWNTLVGVARDDGRLEIEFARSGGLRATPLVTHGNLLSGEESGVAFDRSLGATLLVHVVDDVRTFRLEPDGLYHRVPEDVLDLTLRTEAVPDGGQSWKIGWTWDGAWIRVGQLASDVVGNETQAKITVPRGAQQLWWSPTGIPPDLHGDPGGFQAIQGSAMKVVLR